MKLPHFAAGFAVLPLILLWALWLLPTKVGAASFDCHKAATHMEQTICANKELSDLDTELASLYRRRLAELKSISKAEELRAAQRNWLKGVRLNCHTLNCFVTSYRVRLQELSQFENSALEEGRHSSTSEAETLQRLNRQLGMLKELLLRANDLEVRKYLGGEQAKACQSTAEKLQQATVPIPFMYASTVEEKTKLYGLLKSIAVERRKNFLATDLSSKERNRFEEDFRYAWNQPDLGNFSNTHRVAAHMLFSQSSSPTPDSRVLFSRVLLDHKDVGVTIDLTVLGNRGLGDATPWGQSSESEETFWSHDHEQPFPSPHYHAGLMSLGDDLSYWRLNRDSKRRGEPYWVLMIAPVTDFQTGKFIACEIQFR